MAGVDDGGAPRDHHASGLFWTPPMEGECSDDPIAQIIDGVKRFQPRLAEFQTSVASGLHGELSGACKDDKEYEKLMKAAEEHLSAAVACAGDVEVLLENLFTERNAEVEDERCEWAKLIRSHCKDDFHALGEDLATRAMTMRLSALSSIEDSREQFAALCQRNALALARQGEERSSTEAQQCNLIAGAIRDRSSAAIFRPFRALMRKVETTDVGEWPEAQAGAGDDSLTTEFFFDGTEPGKPVSRPVSAGRRKPSRTVDSPFADVDSDDNQNFDDESQEKVVVVDGIGIAIPIGADTSLEETSDEIVAGSWQSESRMNALSLSAADGSDTDIDVVTSAYQDADRHAVDDNDVDNIDDDRSDVEMSYTPMGKAGAEATLLAKQRPGSVATALNQDFDNHGESDQGSDNPLSPKEPGFDCGSVGLL